MFFSQVFHVQFKFLNDQHHIHDDKTDHHDGQIDDLHKAEQSAPVIDKSVLGEEWFWGFGTVDRLDMLTAEIDVQCVVADLSIFRGESLAV